MKHNSSLGFFVAFLRLLLFAWSFHSLLPFFLLILIPSNLTCILFFVFNVYIFFGTFLLVSLCYFSYSCENISLVLQYSFHSTLCFKIFIFYFSIFCIICSILQFPMSNVYDTFSNKTCIRSWIILEPIDSLMKLDLTFKTWTWFGACHTWTLEELCFTFIILKSMLHL